MTKIHIGNLSSEATERGIREAFAGFGLVQKVSIMCDRHSGEPRGFAFVEMETDEGAASAIAALNGMQLQGTAVTVSQAHVRAAKAG
ncbi:MAG: RNA-binding protein [Phycisphaerae bacterium]|nr:RNA-binding protein [Phycisphaerae bacterium]